MSGFEDEKRIRVIQGEYRVSDDPDVVLTTILGSCVAACLRDPQASVGGMNHFLLPGDTGRAPSQEAERYGVHLMELLVNGLLQRGAKRQRLEAKLFGGARMVKGLSDIGEMNAQFARRFLETEGIRITSHSLGDERGRRVEYRPVSGHARQIFVEKVPDLAIAAAPPVRTASVGTVELF
ncbi:MAG: chemotaxis protein CheD [Hyphomicrobiales bacterium]